MVRIQNSLSFDMIKIPNKNYEMGKYTVTIAEYMHFIKATKKEKLDKWTKEKENHPVTDVSWHDAVEFCNWLNEQQTKYVYRLPTEGEWEYACRAGTDTKWSFGDDKKELDKYAWYDKNSYNLGKEHKDYGTHTVGEKKSNPWGFYDMHGNVFEWCEDWYDKEEKNKLLRGGSWDISAFSTRSAFRSDRTPSDRSIVVGFRLLRTLP